MAKKTTRKKAKKTVKKTVKKKATTRSRSTTKSTKKKTTTVSDSGVIRVKGARENNLKNIDLEIPRNQLVVITGPSGSGKSSLAFDTLYAEGERRYVESLSIYARQYLQQQQRPDVDLIDGLQPTLAIHQYNQPLNPRSTVGTVTEIYDYLRLLYSKLGDMHCEKCGVALQQQSAQQIIGELKRLPSKTKIILLAPMIKGRKGEHLAVFESIRKAGLLRARVDGEIYEIDFIPELDKNKIHTIEAVVDRIVIRDGIEARLAESAHHTLKIGDGHLISLTQPPSGSKDWKEKLYGTQRACLECGISYGELEPRTFSFNSPYGACEQCDGLGAIIEFDPDYVFQDEDQPVSSDAVLCWEEVDNVLVQKHARELATFIKKQKIPKDRSFKKLTKKHQKAIWYGTKEFLGLNEMLHAEYEIATKKEMNRFDEFRTPVVCQSCEGSRLKQIADSVTFRGETIQGLVSKGIKELIEFWQNIQLHEDEKAIAEPIIKEVNARLEFLTNVGLDYMTLHRPANSLSGGEAQRIRLASSIGSGLVGVCYVLDEPSIGLHPRDNHRLLDSIRKLQTQGNSVIVVEHDETVMRASDYLIDIGPEAGLRGGEVVSAGKTQRLLKQAKRTHTLDYLTGKRTIDVPQTRRKIDLDNAIKLTNVTTNNLQNVDATFPLNTLTVVTGVSGSGKSSLVHHTLVPHLRRELHHAQVKPGPFESCSGIELIKRIVEVDQSPIGRTPRSTPITFTGLYDEIRKVFANMRTSKLRGYKASRFSFNVSAGRCEDCQGHGKQKIEMRFLPDLWIPCSTCRGKRFDPATLDVRYKGHNIADVLDLSINQAAEFFSAIPAMTNMLNQLVDVGLGYLRLGQSSDSLSGGEAQRIKLAAKLGKSKQSQSLYVLDEPTTGLHFEDVKKLLETLHRLVDAGNTVIVIEHHLDVIKSADWVIDIGPEGGAAGGRVLASGTPEDVSLISESLTGKFLTEIL